jgi:hypothetical protein
MNLYLITRNDWHGYDQYDSAVVAAPDEEDAKALIEQNLDDWTHYGYVNHKKVNTKLDITIELIGTAVDGIEPGIVVDSYNAG